MTHINKHRFLTELSKFLTFLTDEEKARVLARFDELFDAAVSDEELINVLVSPLKVTVELSRAYNKDGLDAALNRCCELSGIELTAAPAPTPAEELPTESLPDAPAEAPEAEQEDIYDSIGSAVEAAFEGGDDFAAPAEAPAPPVMEAPAQNEPLKTQLPVQEQSVQAKPPVQEQSVQAEPPVREQKAAPQEAPEEKKKEKPEPEKEKKKEHEKPAHTVREDKTQPPSPVPPAPAYSAEELSQPEGEDFVDTEPGDYFDYDDEPPRKKYRVKVFSLILFLIVFIPLGLAGILVLALVTAVILAAAASAVGSGVFAFSLAFSGMALFADIIMTIGVGLIMFAVGIVLMWAGVWFAIWSIGGLVRSIVRLARKCCCKEEAGE